MLGLFSWHYSFMDYVNFKFCKLISNPVYVRVVIIEVRCNFSFYGKIEALYTPSKGVKFPSI